MTDEDKLINLLQQHQAGTLGVESDILELVDTYFRRSLRPVVAKVFGNNVVGATGNDGQCRYTEMVHDFFIKVLEKKPDAFWKAQTAAALRTWASVVIANQMRDTLRRQKQGQQILADIMPLIEQKRTYFQERYRKTFEEFLDQLASWESSSDKSLKLRAIVLRHRYVDGMSWRDIATQLGLSDEALTKIRNQAGTDFGGRAG
ncbi:MAG: RNA polymerase sigma factor [Planctomycetaceae bacterium]